MDNSLLDLDKIAEKQQRDWWFNHHVFKLQLLDERNESMKKMFAKPEKPKRFAWFRKLMR